MSKKKQKVILADKIADLIAPRRLLDPEIDDEDETRAKAIAYELDTEIEDLTSSKGLSDIRKKNVKLLQDVDAKYRGKLSSRKEFENESDDDEIPDDQSDDDDDIETFSKQLKVNGSDSNGFNKSDDNESEGENYNNDSDSAEDVQEDEQDEEMEDEEIEEEEDSEESDFDGGDIVSKDQENETESTVSILPKKQSEDQLKKGLSIQNELQIWEKLLEIRIHCQKLLIKTNCLPTYEKFQKIANHSDEFKSLAEESGKNVTNLLTKMRSLQTHLLRQYPETKEIARKRRNDSTSDGSIDAKRERMAENMSNDFNNLTEYRNSVITKWYDRTKVLTPGSIKTQKFHGNIDVLKKIEGVLAHKDDLLKKTQLFKGGYKLFDNKKSTSKPSTAQKFEANEDEIYCEEIYDDTDFYHTQLRELIEFKTNTSINPNEMAKQFVELQKLRKKMKKNVDTRASKGRKIRYVVHNKLVSFMAPHESNIWTDESKSELYKSLFGQQI